MQGDQVLANTRWNQIAFDLPIKEPRFIRFGKCPYEVK